ncbi:hypothetical protein MTY66_47820 [Mycolicibacterium sp. TY66]|nr:hypothetical protein MTY66_47820 [Mycolicibacterium sp. TY66]BCJ79196.1 hypothetical protein MTY81_05690 [Mycolicibacterium sp. TY81]
MVYPTRRVSRTLANMTTINTPAPPVEYLRAELADKLDAYPMETWPAELLQAAIALIDAAAGHLVQPSNDIPPGRPRLRVVTS